MGEGTATPNGVGVAVGIATPGGVVAAVAGGSGVLVGATVKETGGGVGVAVGSGRGVGVRVAVGVGVAVAVAVGVGVGLGVGVAVGVGVGVGVAVGVAVGVGVFVGVGVTRGVGVGVGVGGSCALDREGAPESTARARRHESRKRRTGHPPRPATAAPRTEADTLLGSDRSVNPSRIAGTAIRGRHGGELQRIEIVGHFRDHFSSVAAEYSRYRPRYPEALFDFLADLVPGSSAVWDCAAGSGQATVPLAARFARVVATDASAEQLSAAPRLANVEYRVATAERSGLPGGTFALITVAQALHWFDLGRFYREVRRVARPGGVLAVWCYGTMVLEGEEVNAALMHLYRDVLGPYWPAERRHVETAYRDLPFPFEEAPAPRFEMAERWTLRQLLGYLATWSARQRYLAERGADPLVPFAARLADLWGDPERPRLVRWPLALRVGRVR